MKRNTGCNSNKHHSCPSLPPCDIAKTKRVDAVHLDFPAFGDPVPVIDVPVPLVEVLLEADIEAKISLPTPARAIKSIEKNVSLKQCKAVPAALLPENVVKLYITGIVHKNIQYVEHCSGNVKDFSVDVPFSVNRTVILSTPTQFPIFGLEYSIKNNILQRRELADDGHGSDRCSSGSLTFEIYNEPIDCKLVASAVKEVDLLKDFDHFGRFNSITEKMEVLLLFKLNQVQQVDAVVGNGPTPIDGQTRVSARDRFRQLTQRMNF